MQSMPLRLLARRALLPSLALAAAALSGQAQSAPSTIPIPPGPVPARFAAEPLVIRSVQLLFSVNPDGTGYREQTFVLTIQSEDVLRTFSVLGVPFAGNSEQVKFLYARVRHPDGTVVNTPLDTALEQTDPVTQQAPLYSDLKQEHLPIKGLGVGDTLEWQVRIDRTKPEAQGQFWGRQNLFNDGPVLAETIELRLPAKAPATVWTNPERKLAPAISTEGDQRVYRWTTSSAVTTVGAEAEAAKKAKAKAVLTAAEQVDALQGKLPDIAWTSFGSWEAVGSWYRGLETGRIDPTPEIVAKVHALTDGKPTMEDKVRAIYAFVSGHIHYIGVDFGIGRYQPHQAATVLENEYGDCKDKHTLLAAMLEVLGLHPDAVLIGSGLRFNPAVPAPDNFNHLITHLTLAPSQEAWLDSTIEVAPYRMLFATLRDKEALVVPLNGPASIARTPADPPFHTFETMAAKGTLDKEGVSESHFTLESRGDEELLVRLVLRQINGSQYDELTQRLVANMGFGGTVSHARFVHAEDPAQPLIMEWDYHRVKAGDDWENLRTLPQIMPVLLPTVNDTDPPLQDIQVLGAREVTSTSELKLPAGWTAELPEAVHAKSVYGTYDMTFHFANGVLSAERHWTVAKAKVPQADWRDYKKWIDEVSPGSEPYVQLRESSGGAAHTDHDTSKPSAPVSSEAKPATSASALIDQAQAAFRKNELTQAKALLDKAAELDPNANSLWGVYGWIALRQGEHLEAMRLYRKEIALHPKSYWAYTSLSQLQYLTDDHTGATATLKEYERQAPDSPEPVAALLQMEISLEQYSAAAHEAEEAATRLPAAARSDPRLQLAVLLAQLHSDHPERGAATAATLLNSTTDPSTRNSVAYALSETNQALPLAEATARDVIARLVAESQSWTLDESWDLLQQRSVLLAASWDTLGWILFREGKPAEALPLIEACWQNIPGAEVGGHLGDVQRALKQPAAALRSYRLALATISPFDAFGVRRQNKTSVEVGLMKKVVALGGRPAAQGNQELQKMRTIELPSALGHDGAVAYKLLLSAHGVVRAEPQGDKSLPGGAELIQKARTSLQLFPPGSPAQLARGATLNCNSGSCQLVLHGESIPREY